MPHTVTIAGTAAGLNQFCTKYSNKVAQTVKQELEFDKDLPSVSVDHSYTGQEVGLSSLLQPYQPGFTPNNAESFDGIDSSLQVAKVDLLFTAEQLENFFTKWKCNWFTPNPTEIKSTYAGYIMGAHVLPQLGEELNQASYSGVRVEPVSGTPGTVLQSFDGFGTQITTHISDGRLVPINTGALLEATMVTQVRDFCRSLPMVYRYKKGKIEMSKTNAQKYADRYQALHPTRKVNEEQQDDLYLKVDHFNKTIVGRTAMEGSDRMICTFDNHESMLVGKRKGFPDYFQFRFQEFDRQLKVFAEIYRFYNFDNCLHTFVNDQA